MEKSDFSNNICYGLHDFLYKLQLQQGQEEQNLSLMQLMVLVKVPWRDCNCNSLGEIFTKFCLKIR